MSRNEAFLRAILDDPEDDAVRLVYADWLEDNGRSERAEFIRVQIERTNLPPGHPRRDLLADRERGLWKRHGKRWEAELPGPENLGFIWRRGFADELTLYGGGIGEECAEAILAAVPLRRLVLIDWGGYQELASSPLLTRTRELEILVHDHSELHGGQFEHLDLEEVLGWPAAEHLTHLGLLGHRLTEEGLRALTGANLPRLRSLALRDPWGMQGTDIWGPLIEAGWLTHLETLTVEKHSLPPGLVGPLCARLRSGRVRSLTLAAVGIGDTEAGEMVRARLPASLTDLRLIDNRIGPAGARLLSESLPETLQLTLDGNPLGGDGGLRALAVSPLLTYVTRLNFTGPGVDDEAVTSLATSPYGQRLQAIVLKRGSVGSAGARALLTSEGLPALTFLDLERNIIEALPPCHHPRLGALFIDGNRLDDKGVAAFCADSRLPALENLSLQGNRLGPARAAALANAPGFSALEHLYLGGNPLGDEGPRALANAQDLPGLKTLSLPDCGIGDEGVAAWMDSPMLASVGILWLRSGGNPIRQEVFEALQKRASEFACEVY